MGRYDRNLATGEGSSELRLQEVRRSGRGHLCRYRPRGLLLPKEGAERVEERTEAIVESVVLVMYSRQDSKSIPANACQIICLVHIGSRINSLNKEVKENYRNKYSKK